MPTEPPSPRRRGPKPITTANAAAVYRRRTSRDPEDDAALGLLFAFLAYARRWRLKAITLAYQALRRGEVPRVPGAPAWWRAALERYLPWLPDLHDLGVLAIPPWLDQGVVPRLLDRGEGAPTSTPLAPELRAALRPAFQDEADALAPRSRAAAGSLKAEAARKDALVAFYLGLRASFARRRREPTPSEVTLLAASVGLEPLDPNLDATRKRWEDRLRIWKREPVLRGLAERQRVKRTDRPQRRRRQ